MRMNILSYVKSNREGLSSSPFNRVDALVLCWLSYFCYPEYIKESGGAALKDMPLRGLLPDKLMFAQAFRPRTSKRLFRELTISPRFENFKLSDYRDERSETEEKQFAALMIELSENRYFISFRGTDPSFVGWKEDFNLMCRCPVPSQLAAAEYVKEQMSRHSEALFYIGGHSKGGNVAVYSAAACGVRLRERLLSVYNFDGPGFIDDACPCVENNEVFGKINKLIPAASFVGALLENGGEPEVIGSRGIGLLQHDPFCWRVANNDFIYLDRRTHGSVRLERAVNLWIKGLTLSERERMVEIIYAALSTLDTKSFNVFFKTIYRQIPALYRHYRRVNADDREFFNAQLKRLCRLLTVNNK